MAVKKLNGLGATAGTPVKGAIIFGRAMHPRHRIGTLDLLIILSKNTQCHEQTN
jgi:hypothetical protein